MARRRKTETKAPIKQQPKSGVRKSTRQKAKKEPSEEETVSDEVNSENANSSENLTDSNDANGKESPQVDIVNKLEMPQRCVNESYSTTNVASIENFEFSQDEKPAATVNENSLSDTVCNSVDIIEETTIYEEMEIETESTVDCPTILDKNAIEQIIYVSDSKNDSITNSPDCFDKSLPNVSSECVSSNNYQEIEKSLSGLHMSESEANESSQEQPTLMTVEAVCTAGSQLDNSDKDLNATQCESRKILRNARAKRLSNTSVKSTVKKDNDHRKKKSDRSIEPNSNNADSSKTLNNTESYKTNDNWLKEIKDDKLELKQLIETLKPTVSEQHSINSEINIKMDLEDVKDVKLFGGGESCTSESNDQCDMNDKRTETKIKSEENDAAESNSSGVRRSNRIKHIGLRKQRSRGRGLVVKPSQESQKAYAGPMERGGDSKLASGVVPELAEQRAIQLNKVETQFDKDNTKCIIPSRENLTPALPMNTSAMHCGDSDSNKPVKVKSRWRRSSELEMSNSTSWSAAAAPQSNFALSSVASDTIFENRSSLSDNTIDGESNCNADSLQTSRVLLEQGSNSSAPLESNVPVTLSSNLSPIISTASVNLNNVGAKICLPMVPEVDREMEERLSQFEHLKENLYLTDRYTNKETKRMVCDCFLTEEEIDRGELGCGEDCLNRLLMIECGSRCVVGDRCTNKRFQSCNYANCEVFRTEKKGFGLRATTNLNAGDFIMEYVGEVVDSRDFRKRAKEYSKDKNRHYYFMALKSDQIIDATMKGNISRFINHSCDPNAETQKWTVNGELRIGFFNKKFVAAGEEITFDYHFQRYGKEAQKCFCEAENCRGWIGDNPEDGKSNAECTEDDDFETEDESESEEEREENEVKKPKKQVRKNKREEKKIVDHMEDEDLEEQIDKLCAGGLKNRVHTLTLSRLMVRCRELQHRRRLLQVIQSGEQPCRRLFLDYHGLRLMWSYMMDVAGIDTEEAQQFRLEIIKTLLTLPIPNRTMLIDSKVLSVVEKWSKQQICDSPTSGESPPDDDQPKQLKPTSGEQPEQESMKEETKKDGSSPTAKSTNGEQSLIAELAVNLLEAWSNLKEVFRIPKKERLEQMKEHERDADRGYKEDEVEKEAARETSLSYERHRSAPTADKPRDRRRGRESPNEAVIRPNLVQVPRMSKYERRQLFALKVAKEAEERQRRQQEELWQQHQAQCLALGVDPYATAALDPQSGYPLYFDPQLGQWQAFPGQLADGALYQQQLLQQQQQQSFAQLAHNGALAQQQPPHQECEQLEIAAGAEQPPPALDLPPKWKWARDKRGRVYYYHAKERVSQWLPPPPDHIGMQPDSGPDSSSGDESSADDDDDDDSTADEVDDDDESVSSRDNDEDEEREAAAAAAVVVATDDTEHAGEREEPANDEDEEQKQLVPSGPDSMDVQEAPPPAAKPPENNKRRRDGLVQERIISPRREEDRVDHSKFKELKEKLRRQKEKSRLKEHLQSEKNRKHRRGSSSLKSKSHAKQSQVKSFQAITSDMSPTTERKIKDTFRINMAHVMVHFLNPYRKNDCKQGRITNTEDFKYLARKLTHFVLAKELKHCKSVDELECNDNVKHKAKDFVRKYMNKFGAIYQRDKDED